MTGTSPVHTAHPGLPHIDAQQLQRPDTVRLSAPLVSTHPPRILMLYGSLRERSFSRLATEEAARILQALGAEVKTFDPTGLPLADGAPDSHPKVVELRALAAWSANLFKVFLKPRKSLFGMGCKAWGAANSSAIGKRRNAADRPKRHLPEGLE